MNLAIMRQKTPKIELSNLIYNDNCDLLSKMRILLFFSFLSGIGIALGKGGHKTTLSVN